jgi:cytochrome oxidase Cu insertion factor (SCO1/SenC/PrrC family)
VTLRGIGAALILAAAAVATLPGPVAAFTPVAAEGDALGAPPLVDMGGGAVDTVHDVTVVSFIYTRCPDPAMCPLVTAKFQRMAQLLHGTRIRLLEISLDPAFDRPIVLRAYAKAFGADGRRWTFATGEPVAIAAFAERMGLFVTRPRPGIIAHTEAVIVARDGVVIRNIGGNTWSADEVAAEARATAELPANPLERFALRVFGGIAAVCGAVGARGVTPAAAAGVFLVLFAAAALSARTLLLGILGER